MNFLLHFIFITAFLLVYVVAIIILKPFRKHRKRPVSTITLKISYLVYLAAFSYLENAGLTGVHIYRNTAGFPHQKVMLIDE